MPMSAMDLVYVAVILVIGLQVFNQFNDSTTSLTTTTVSRAAAGNVSSNTFGGFQTAAVAPTVIGAVIVLGVVGLLVSKR